MLVTVKHSSGKGKRLKLSEEDTLFVIREYLMTNNVMSETDKFVSQGFELLVSEEKITKLDEILEDGILNIGVAAEKTLNTDIGKVDYYMLLNEVEKKECLSKIGIYKGVTFNEDAIGFSTADVYELADGYMPAEAVPITNTVYCSTYSFSESMRELDLITSNKVSLSLDSVYIDAKTEYEKARNKHSNKHNIEEYLLAKYLIGKLTVEMNPDFLKPTKYFIEGIKAVFDKSKGNMNDDRYSLVEVLNQYGAYIPLKFTLGGKIYSKEETEISEFSVAEQEKKSFSASAKVKFAPFSIGGSYSNSEENKSSVTENSKYKTLTIEQTGGATGLAENPAEFNKSLNIAINWKIIDIERFYPSLLLLLNKEDVLLGKCVKLLNGVNDNKELITKIQPYIDIQKYAATVMYYMEQ